MQSSPIGCVSIDTSLAAVHRVASSLRPGSIQLERLTKIRLHVILGEGNSSLSYLRHECSP